MCVYVCLFNGGFPHAYVKIFLEGREGKTEKNWSFSRVAGPWGECSLYSCWMARKGTEWEWEFDLGWSLFFPNLLKWNKKNGRPEMKSQKTNLFISLSENKFCFRMFILCVTWKPCFRIVTVLFLRFSV